MPTEEVRQAFGEAIKNKESPKLSRILKRDDVKELLLMKDDSGYLPIHDACRFNSDKPHLQLILDAAVEHGIIKKVLEGQNKNGWHCLHLASTNLSTDSFRLLLEYLYKYSDMKRVLKQKDNYGQPCLHFACRGGLSTDSLRILLEHLSEHTDIKKILEEKNNCGLTCLHFACRNKLSADSLRLLLEYLSKHTDILKMLEEINNDGWNCLHFACRYELFTDSRRLLVAHFPSDELLQQTLRLENNRGQTALNFAKPATKDLLEDPECWRKCRQSFSESVFVLPTWSQSLVALRSLNSTDSGIQKSVILLENKIRRETLPFECAAFDCIAEIESEQQAAFEEIKSTIRLSLVAIQQKIIAAESSSRWETELEMNTFFLEETLARKKVQLSNQIFSELVLISCEEWNEKVEEEHQDFLLFIQHEVEDQMESIIDCGIQNVKPLDFFTLRTLHLNSVQELSALLDLDPVDMDKMGMTKNQRKHLLQLIEAEKTKSQLQHQQSLAQENKKLREELSKLKNRLDSVEGNVPSSSPTGPSGSAAASASPETNKKLRTRPSSSPAFSRRPVRQTSVIFGVTNTTNKDDDDNSNDNDGNSTVVAGGVPTHRGSIQGGGSDTTRSFIVSTRDDDANSVQTGTTEQSM